MKRLIILCSALFLVACGGGGGGGEGGSSASGAGDIKLVASPDTGMPTGVDTSHDQSYPAGSDALLAYQRLNRNREQCGFGKLTQNAQLDRASAAHVAYVLTEQVLGHYEIEGKPSFTGKDPKARAAAAGYDLGGVGEVMAGMLLTPSLLPRGDLITEMLMDVPYHAVVMLQGMSEVGISYKDGVMVMNPGHTSKVPMKTPTGVLTYPCDGITDVRASVGGEEPTPFPADAAATQWGPTISVVGHAVKVTVASVTGPKGSVAIKAVLGDGATKDPNGFCSGANACVVPQPLDAGASYRVHIEGTDAGVSFVKDFSFVTSPY